jgi:hypothetical protein
MEERKQEGKLKIQNHLQLTHYSYRRMQAVAYKSTFALKNPQAMLPISTDLPLMPPSHKTSQNTKNAPANRIKATEKCTRQPHEPNK